MAIEGEVECDQFWQGLEEKEQPEFAMVQLSDAATHPEAVMVKFAYAAVALPTMSTSEGLDHLTGLTEALLR